MAPSPAKSNLQMGGAERARDLGLRWLLYVTATILGAEAAGAFPNRSKE